MGFRAAAMTLRFSAFPFSESFFFAGSRPVLFTLRMEALLNHPFRFLSCKVLEILMKRAGIFDNRTVPDVPDLCGEPVHEGLVVGDKEEGAIEVLQGINEHLRRDDVQVVGRFVHNHEVARFHQDFCEDTRARSPPERIPTVLSTSAPEKRNARTSL